MLVYERETDGTLIHWAALELVTDVDNIHP